jgi:hypothetical protein
MQAGFCPEIGVFLCLCQELFVIFLKSKKMIQSLLAELKTKKYIKYK